MPLLEPRDAEAGYFILMLKIIIERKKTSYDFKVNRAAPDSFENNWKNNSQDWLIVKDGKAEIARFKCQSVANYCFGDMATADTVSWGDTVAPGQFKLRLFAEPRNFHGEIHEIIEATDIDGQRINTHSTQKTTKGFQNGRWLIHSRYSTKFAADTKYAWSAGCFILSSGDMATLNKLFHCYSLPPGMIIPGEVTEI